MDRFAVGSETGRRPVRGIKKILKIMRKIMIIIGIGVMMSACNVTRVITNESKYIQRGDTSVVIQTKTVESYDASKKL